jgi:hypothetical protein
MPRLKVAHLREQGQDMIVVPLDREPSHGTTAAIQAAASSADLAGQVVPVWQQGSSVYFRAPQPWHPFFRNITWNWVIGNLNRELSW